MLRKGDEFTHNNLTYTVVGKIKRSYQLKCSNGVTYTATEKTINESMKKIKNGTEEFTQSKYPHLERRVQLEKAWGKNVNIPTNKNECDPWFSMLECELSPENLCCDGELSRNQVLIKHKEILATWKELEKISGAKREPIY